MSPASFKPANWPDWQPQRVLLFSGHMLDAANRPSLRFPKQCAAIAAQKIQQTLHDLNAGPDDLALTQGSQGGDILFAEACLHFAVKLQLLQPFAQEQFIQNSVISAGDDWLVRYQQIVQQLLQPPQAVGVIDETLNPYQQCNQWLLDTALSYGLERMIFICLWDGQAGPAGGTADMVNSVKQRGGQVIWLDTRQMG